MVFYISNKSKLLLFLFFLFVCRQQQPFDGVVAAEDGSSSSSPSGRVLFGSNNRVNNNINGQQQQQHMIHNCGELVSKSQCSHNSNCTWCTSQDLDDTCFSKSESLRLPYQVFSCGPTR